MTLIFLILKLLQEHCSTLIQVSSEKHEQGAVDDRDIFLHGVRDLLSIHSSKRVVSLSDSGNFYLFVYVYHFFSFLQTLKVEYQHTSQLLVLFNRYLVSILTCFRFNSNSIVPSLKTEEDV